MSEEQQRYGGARGDGTIDMDSFRRDVQEEDAAEQKKKARHYFCRKGSRYHL